MKKIFTFLILMIGANHAWADWERFGSLANGNIFYMQTGALYRDGNFVKVFIIENKPQLDRFGDRSNKQLVEVDCRGLRTRSLSFASFDGSMATGNPTGYDSKTEPWDYAKPGTVDMKLVKTACAPR
ncbi:surface-adhesin E family protein [Polynucleobacter yangtzensis]|uniref:Surface-adhesin protein E-like domain-containing protein n=1 Tax=Polynucleobacter yangtzensis TaxID=1743159 RepID=A0ABM8CM84_9BURK|nr:surface-adhesin E family protein [Polynucleobacter yangtzensis]BDT78939.1 hypothetical protein PKF032_08270 [Polynucleobacter yangtzensis]